MKVTPYTEHQRTRGGHMTDRRPVRPSPGRDMAYRMGQELGWREQEARIQTRRRREVHMTEDSVTLVEEEIIIEERYW